MEQLFTLLHHNRCQQYLQEGSGSRVFFAWRRISYLVSSLSACTEACTHTRLGQVICGLPALIDEKLSSCGLIRRSSVDHAKPRSSIYVCCQVAIISTLDNSSGVRCDVRRAEEGVVEGKRAVSHEMDGGSMRGIFVR